MAESKRYESPGVGNEPIGRLVDAYLAVYPGATRIPGGMGADALHDAMMILMGRTMWRQWSVDRICAWLWRAIRWVLHDANRRAVVHRSAMALHQSYVEAGPLSVLDACDVRTRAMRAWQRLAPGERRAFLALHILEEDVPRGDKGVYARRIRIARRRLEAC